MRIADKGGYMMRSLRDARENGASEVTEVNMRSTPVGYLAHACVNMRLIEEARRGFTTTAMKVQLNTLLTSICIRGELLAYKLTPLTQLHACQRFCQSDVLALGMQLELQLLYKHRVCRQTNLPELY
eukprot:gb/GECG01001647.1/.p1 GENE.gb/GECG01001647.1/~~gb/GECG01001647.1/.p1  ORF type:complete len:127 (+),score=2.98 gb/GECG01001647.1/:1-381(+)